MDIDARIERRQRLRSDGRLATDDEWLSPVEHINDPVARGSVVERLLDLLDPAFDGKLPADSSLYGPKGAGKSAVVSALFDRLSAVTHRSNATIHTSTRVAETRLPRFVYIDGRAANTRFSLYRNLLDGLIAETVPRQGVGTDWILERLTAALEDEETGIVAAVDHLGESGTKTVEWLLQTVKPLPGVACLTVSRERPTPSVGIDDARVFGIEPYQQHVLRDILMTRANGGLPGEGIGHELAKMIAEWAEGDAHDALAALLSATDIATADGRTRLRTADITAGIEAVPRPAVSLSKIVSLPANKQAVLRALVDIDAEDRESVTTAASAIAADCALALSADTVERFLYQLADASIVQRVPHRQTTGKGRPPSRVEFRFPARAFARLYDAQNDSPDA
jgi:Cdc6-like AAA superfamily ATPase